MIVIHLPFKIDFLPLLFLMQTTLGAHKIGTTAPVSDSFFRDLYNASQNLIYYVPGGMPINSQQKI
jgi:hypothetical protein